MDHRSCWLFAVRRSRLGVCWPRANRLIFSLNSCRLIPASGHCRQHLCAENAPETPGLRAHKRRNCELCHRGLTVSKGGGGGRLCLPTIFLHGWSVMGWGEEVGVGGVYWTCQSGPFVWQRTICIAALSSQRVFEACRRRIAPTV